MSDTAVESPWFHAEDTKKAQPLTILLHKSMVSHAQRSAPVLHDQVAQPGYSMKYYWPSNISLSLFRCVGLTWLYKW